MTPEAWLVIVTIGFVLSQAVSFVLIARLMRKLDAAERRAYLIEMGLT